MRSFSLGFLCALLLSGGVYAYFLRRAEPDPCRACSVGTHCAVGVCVANSAPVQAVAKKRVFRRGSGGGAGNTAGRDPSGAIAGNPGPGPGPGPGPAEIQQPEAPPPPPPPPLRPEDRKMVSAGDKLTTTEVLNLAEAERNQRELTQEDIDGVFRPRQSGIISCIDDARGEAQLDGHLTVAFRILRSGAIGGVRVEAPNYLMEHGLLACVRKVVQALPFPASSRGQVVTYPFALH